MSGVVIGIEGRFKTGKTTLAHSLSKEYNAPILDMGVLYRIVASQLKRMTKEEIKKKVIGVELEQIMEDLQILYDYDKCAFFPLPEDIQTPVISNIAAFIGELTNEMWYEGFRKIIRNVNKNRDIILVGRNVLRVYPDLDLHFFLDSTTEKIVQLTLKGQNIKYEEAWKMVKERMISEEKLKRLFVQDGRTIFIDISEKNQKEVIQLVNEEIKKRLEI